MGNVYLADYMKLVKICRLYLFVLKGQYSSKLSCHKSQSKAEELFQIKGAYSDMTKEMQYMIAAGSYSTGRKTALNGKIDKMGTRMIVQRKTLYCSEMF